MRQTILYQDETGMWVAECPSLPGCISQGETRQAAIANIRDAITQYIASLEADGEPVPEDSFSALIVAV
jgi:predicted RNase H-like HicB family nuclease